MIWQQWVAWLLGLLSFLVTLTAFFDDGKRYVSFIQVLWFGSQTAFLIYVALHWPH